MEPDTELVLRSIEVESDTGVVYSAVQSSRLYVAVRVRGAGTGLPPHDRHYSGVK